MTEFTKKELKEFDRITKLTGSINQVKRISARLELRTFIKMHGKPKCDAMHAELVKQGKW